MTQSDSILLVNMEPPNTEYGKLDPRRLLTMCQFILGLGCSHTRTTCPSDITQKDAVANSSCGSGEDGMHFTSQRFSDASSCQDEIGKRRQHLESAGHPRKVAEDIIIPDPQAMKLNGSFFICGCHYFADGPQSSPLQI